MLETIFAYALLVFAVVFVAIGVGTLATGGVEALVDRQRTHAAHGSLALHH